MKRSLLLVVLALKIILVSGQSVRVFDGFIDVYPIQVFLNYDGSKVNGYYFYKKYEIPIQISGEITGKQLKLTEQPYKNGTLESKPGGEVILDERLNGIWRGENKELKVSLKEIKSQISWDIFEPKVELTYTLINNQKYTFPVILDIVTPNYPEHEKLLNLIIPEILGLDANSLKDTWYYFNTYVSKIYSDYINDFSPENPPDYEKKMSGIVVSLSDSILNYETSGSDYQGGAHAYEFTNYFIFDLKQMKRLKFNDIFKPGVKSVIAELLSEKDNKVHKIEDFEGNLENIYMTNKGIGFFFDLGKIDCYACGTFNYFLNFSELQGLIRI